MKPSVNSNKSATFKTFKGIHLTAEHKYYLCDFYQQQNELGEDIYEVLVETAQHLKSTHQLVYQTILKQWVCSNPDDLPSALIEKIIEQIQLIQRY